jgi:hypothetical protein
VGQPSGDRISEKLLEDLVWRLKPRLIRSWRELESWNPALGIDIGFRTCAGSRSYARRDRELSITNFDEFDAVASSESKLFADVGGKSNAAIEGDHCGRHLLPL